MLGRSQGEGLGLPGHLLGCSPARRSPTGPGPGVPQNVPYVPCRWRWRGGVGAGRDGVGGAGRWDKDRKGWLNPHYPLPTRAGTGYRGPAQGLRQSSNCMM